MGKMKRLQKRLQMKPPATPATWAGEASELELEIERKLEAIEARYAGKAANELPEAVLAEYGRLQCDLIEESQRRSGVTLLKITRNADDSGATYDASNFLRLMENVQMLVDAGIPTENAVARSLEDERFRQQSEAAENLARPGGRFFGSIKNFFQTSLDSLK